MVPGFVVRENKGLIWFDFSPSERDALRGFSSEHKCPLLHSEDMPPTNKQIRHCKWSMCEFSYVRPRVHISLYKSVFFKICLPHFVCVCLSSSWQMPSTVQLGPSHRRGHRDPRFSLGPMRLFYPSLSDVLLITYILINTCILMNMSHVAFGPMPCPVSVSCS